MPLISFILVVEDDLSEAVVRKILRHLDRDFEVTMCLGRKGQGYIKDRVSAFNDSAKGSPFLLLTDLDRYECAPSLINEWLQTPQHENLLFRVAVREVESWLLAHRTAIARFLGVPRERIPLTPEGSSHPKADMIGLARRSGKNKIREDIVPIGTSRQGRNYNGRLIEFVENDWDVDEAVANSDSLQRFCHALATFNPVFRT